ncbi:MULTISPECIES: DUF397 domain-containing protein [Streptomyces]|uniref:DUF397 domain-containing protein n=2 Tax=Streptomyces TaxID=1883 RepID=A0A1I6P1X4_9ACTN|nr:MULTISPECIES: DUF397 domain-containing protein [Streptomyces]MCK1816924.1 DUF397 domain-containing protein [Streptomyces sp. XM4011]QKV70148.1 DUF397 domain-containing protein [Streptomyces harbinensis]SFS34204.1 protein of unknown function [Streptomyces harbinensis]
MPPEFTWRRSRYSGASNAACVEVSDGHPAGLPVRDSKSPDGPVVFFPSPAWSAFIADLKNSR